MAAAAGPDERQPEAPEAPFEMGGGSWCPTPTQVAEARVLTEEFRQRLEAEFHVRPILCFFWFPKENNCQVLVGTAVPKFALVPLLSFVIANAGYTPGEVRRFVSWYRSGGVLGNHPAASRWTRRLLQWLFGDETPGRKYFRTPLAPVVAEVYKRLEAESLVEPILDRVRQLAEGQEPLRGVPQTLVALHLRPEEVLALRDFLAVTFGEKGG